MNLNFRIYFTFLFFLITGCASNSGTVEIRGGADKLANKIEISTFNFERPFMGIVNPYDYFLRGFIDKSSQKITHQVYFIVNSADWMYWDEARFIFKGNIKNVPAREASSDVYCSEFGCAHYEDVVITLDSSVLKDWAAQTEDIKLRLVSSSSTKVIDIAINPDEVKAYLDEVTKASN
ncbi:hypothetical protein [Pseudoalteromonas sp. CH_XMU1449-3]|uniref:hypothetical protein n=1 Tax=Pseudoalteromonas sp. CH_XMU1449-3 TaxID=3107774 RepID=UPI00300BA904